MNARHGSSSFAAIFAVASLIGIGAGGYRLLKGTCGDSCAGTPALVQTSDSLGLCSGAGRPAVCGGAMLAPAADQATIEAPAAPCPHDSQASAAHNGACGANEGSTEANRDPAPDTTKKTEHVSAAAER